MSCCALAEGPPLQPATGAVGVAWQISPRRPRNLGPTVLLDPLPNIGNEYLCSIAWRSQRGEDGQLIASHVSLLSALDRGDPAYLNRISASLGGASAGVKLPCGGAAG